MSLSLLCTSYFFIYCTHLFRFINKLETLATCSPPLCMCSHSCPLPANWACMSVWTDFLDWRTELLTSSLLCNTSSLIRHFPLHWHPMGTGQGPANRSTLSRTLSLSLSPFLFLSLSLKNIILVPMSLRHSCPLSPSLSRPLSPSSLYLSLPSPRSVEPVLSFSPLLSLSVVFRLAGVYLG